MCVCVCVCVRICGAVGVDVCVCDQSASFLNMKGSHGLVNSFGSPIFNPRGSGAGRGRWEKEKEGGGILQHKKNCWCAYFLAQFFLPAVLGYR